MSAPVSDYPEGWPLCACGDPVLDGHLTCGRLECDEAGARSLADRAFSRAEDASRLDWLTSGGEEETR